VLPLPPLTPEEKKAYDKYAEQLRADCPVAYERGYVQQKLVQVINAVYGRDHGAILNQEQRKAVLTTGADRDHFIAHCEHLAKEVLEDCQQQVVHKSLDYTSVTACMKERLGKGAATRYVFQHCGGHSVDLPPGA
jgi:hypothetical protein